VDGEGKVIWRGSGPITYSFTIQSVPHPDYEFTHYQDLSEAWKYRMLVRGAEGEYQNSVPQAAFLADTKAGIIRDIAEYIVLSNNDKQFLNLPKLQPSNIEIIDQTGAFGDLDINAIYANAALIANTPPPPGESQYIIKISEEIPENSTEEQKDKRYNVKIIYSNGYLDYAGLQDDQELKEGIDMFSKIPAELVPVVIARYILTTAQKNDILPSPLNTKIVNFTDNPNFTIESISNTIMSMMPPPMPVQVQAPMVMQQMNTGKVQEALMRPIGAQEQPKQITQEKPKTAKLEEEKEEEPEKNKESEKEEEEPGENEESSEKESDNTKWFEFFKPKYGFDSVIGMDYVKKYFYNNIILGIKKPELFAKYKKSIHDGFLLYGPPGVGKTYLVAALAKEANAKLLVVNLHQLLDQYVGNTEKNIHKLFAQARKYAPSIILLDEIDGLGASRNLARQRGNQTSTLALQQLLTEMSSLENENKDVVVIGTTNAPQDIDPALLRSGRFTNLLYIRPPDKEERAKLFEFYTEGIPKSKIDYEKLGAESKNLSPADINAVVKAAVTPLIAHAAETGEIKELTTEDLLKAIRAKRASGTTMIKWYEDMNKMLKNGEFSEEEKLLYGEMIKDIKNRIKEPVKTKKQIKKKQRGNIKKRLRA